MKSDRRHSLWTDLNHPHFVTAVTKDREKIFSDDACAKFLIDQWKFYSERYNVELIAGVVMPDHFHLIIWPRGEKTFSDFMHGVKGYFAKWYGEECMRRGVGASPIDSETEPHINRQGSHALPVSGKVHVPKIWQDSFFDYVIPNEEKLNEKIEYILHNPVEDNLVADWRDYPYIFLSEEYQIE